MRLWCVAAEAVSYEQIKACLAYNLVKFEPLMSNRLTLRYGKVMFILELSDITSELPRKRVTVSDYPDETD